MSGFATAPFPNPPTDNQFGDSFNTTVHTVQSGVIIGATIGSVVFVGSIVGAFLIWRHKTGGTRRRRTRQNGNVRDRSPKFKPSSNAIHAKPSYGAGPNILGHTRSKTLIHPRRTSTTPRPKAALHTPQPSSQPISDTDLAVPS
ncbi:hypothetical protein CPC08DRAFT_823173 [Agrocybe pediades]|nr:hypothetical protein CPC08DRAFT_823173 [Agrocybe pediades]